MPMSVNSDSSPLLDETNFQRFEKPRVPYRYVLVGMLFFGFLNSLATRMCFNIALVEMVNYTDPSVNGTSDHCANIPDLNINTTSQGGGEFDWDASTQSLLLAAFFYGYVVTQLPGGYLAEQIGSKLVFGMAVFLPSVLSLLTPFVARWNVKVLIALRIIMGLTEGPLFPSCFALLGVWAPPLERTQMLQLATIGAPVGTVVGQLLAGYFCDLTFLAGWPLVFYFFGILGILWFVVWMLICKNSPEQHPGLSQYERMYINSTLKSSGKRGKTYNRPWLKILFSRATLALYIYYIFDGIGYSGFMSGMPIYLHQILKFDIAQNGLIVALPNIGQALLAAFCGFFADWLRKHCLSTTATRKLLVFISEGSLVAFALGMGFLDCNRAAAVALYICSITVMGIGAGGSTTNTLDIAPAYAGTVHGIANLFANSGGFISPMIIGYITDNSTNSKEWSIVFFGMSASFFIAVTTFLLFGSGVEQDWAKVPEREQETQPIVYSIEDTDDPLQHSATHKSVHSSIAQSAANCDTQVQ